MISFKNSCCNFNLDFLFLVGVASVGSVATFGVVSVGSAAGSAAGSAVGSHVGILSAFFI